MKSVTLGAVLTVFLAVSLAMASLSSAADLSRHSGEYRGLMRSDASPVGYGEIVMRIAGGELKTWIATGQGIDRQQRPWDEYIPLSPAETAALFRPGSPYPARITAFRSAKNRWPMKLLFLRDPDFERGEFAVMLRHDTFDTQLLSSAQVARGDFEKLIAVTDRQFGKGRLPRLAGAEDAPSGGDLKAREAGYRSAAEGGNPQAQHNLGVVLLARGENEEAAMWFRRASDQRYASSQKNLGSMYLKGIGLAKDPVIAYAYYFLADKNGAPGMKSALAQAAAELSPDQIRAAERKAASLGRAP